MVSAFCSQVNGIALRFFHEENNDREDDSAVDTAYPITPPPAAHHLTRALICRYDQ